jgi:hypothetical protein
MGTKILYARTKAEGIALGTELAALMRLLLDERAAPPLSQAAPTPLRPPTPVALGFDLEWRPNFIAGQSQNPVALVQLAAADRVYLFQIVAWARPSHNRPLTPEQKESRAREMLGDGFVEVLTNPAILKVGVGISGDVAKLAGDYGIELKGALDLSVFANMRKDPSGSSPRRHRSRSPSPVSNAAVVSAHTEAAIDLTASAAAASPVAASPDVAAPSSIQPWPRTTWSLAKLLTHTHGLEMSKSKKIRLSNWEQYLSPGQSHYAALDAWVGWDIFRVLHDHHLKHGSDVEVAIEESLADRESKGAKAKAQERRATELEAVQVTVRKTVHEQHQTVTISTAVKASSARAAIASSVLLEDDDLIDLTLSASIASSSSISAPPPLSSAAEADQFDPEFISGGSSHSKPRRASPPATTTYSVSATAVTQHGPPPARQIEVIDE